MSGLGKSFNQTYVYGPYLKVCVDLQSKQKLHITPGILAPQKQTGRNFLKKKLFTLSAIAFVCISSKFKQICYPPASEASRVVAN